MSEERQQPETDESKDAGVLFAGPDGRLYRLPGEVLERHAVEQSEAKEIMGQMGPPPPGAAPAPPGGPSVIYMNVLPGTTLVVGSGGQDPAHAVQGYGLWQSPTIGPAPMRQAMAGAARMGYPVGGARMGYPVGAARMGYPVGAARMGYPVGARLHM